ncbi:MAG: hypothetical protein Q4B09_03805 [Lachnospiraceae bacterium]|nr:hypothetical protein [Lachnospiraceae bacterium]
MNMQNRTSPSDTVQQKKSGAGKLQKLAAGSIYTIAAALVLNCVLQLLVYPQLASGLGAEANGTVLYLMAFVNILGPSIGQALNNSRLVLRRDYEVSNGDYNIEILLYSAVGILITLLAAADSLHGIGMPVLAAVLILLTNFRYYGDVEYRLNLQYRNYFFYYAICGAGYAVGFLLYRATGNWFLIFLTGEAAALLYVILTGSIFRSPFRVSPYFKTVLKRGAILVLSYSVTNLTLNIDRLYLKHTLGGEAVTIYYVASLIGKTLVLFIAPINTVLISHLTKNNIRPDRRMFLKFVGIGAAVSCIFFAACEIGTPIFVRIFYPSLTESVAPILTIVTATQILAMLSAYLFIIVLTFTGERWQLALQCCHLAAVLLLISVMTPAGGLAGFSGAVLIANTLRIIAVIALGIIAAGKQQKAA